jgi:hypothetical protein
MAVYTNRIGEGGVLIDRGSIQLWAPSTYQAHAEVIHSYLTNGYDTLSQLFGAHLTPYRFSIEHYPAGNPYVLGGTDSQGTVRYDYTNLEDDTPEWNLYGVPHMSGYYEEMAHCFVHDFSDAGFYETLGLMMGGEATLRSAWTPLTQAQIAGGYVTYSNTAAYYLAHNEGPPGVAANIWPTRVLAHVFKSQVVDPFGWAAFSRAFAALREQGYPLRGYAAPHSWGAFLDHLSGTLTNDFHAVFAAYGLPQFSWAGDGGFESDAVEATPDGAVHRFRIRARDVNGDVPTQVRLFLYDGFGQTLQSPYALTNAGGSAAQGWTFQTEIPLTHPEQVWYAFAAVDGRHSVFQAVGTPTKRHAVSPVPPVPATVAWQIGNSDGSSSGFDGTPQDDPVTVLYVVGSPLSFFPSTLGTDIGAQRTVVQIAFTNSLDWGGTLRVRWSPGGSPSLEQYRVACDGLHLWDSDTLAGSSPYAWYTDYIDLPPSSATNHIITLTHLRGDGLVFDSLGLIQARTPEPPHFVAIANAGPSSANARVELQWQGELGRRYRLLHTTNLLAGFPEIIASGVLCSNLPVHFTHTLAPSAETPHFYRVTVER